MKNNNRKNGIFTFGVMALGMAFGILSKLGDVAVQGNVLGDTLRAFGYISSGFFIWVVICTGICVLSKTRLWTAINIATFLIAMLLAYYLYSYFVVDYLALRIVKFWVILLIPSAVLGCMIWDIQTNKIVKHIVFTAGTFIMIYDMIAQGLMPIAMVIYAALYGTFFRLTMSKSKYFDRS